MLDQVSTARMLTLLTCRPEFRPPWTTHAPVTQVTLSRLGRAQVEAMIPSLTGNKTLPIEMVEQVIAKTDGVPLFVEELVKMILESSLVLEQADRYVLTGPLPPLAIPSTLHDSLMARLDRLPTARELVQLGAVLGREFAYDLLQAVAPVDEMTLQQGLAQLVDAELVYQRGLPPRSRYLFKHALIQDAAYQSLLKITRQQYHQRIAQVLEERFPNIVETQPELLAYHYTEANLNGQALPYWQRAGERAIQRSANVEAITQLTKGIELLKTLPDTPERTQQEILLQVTLGVPLSAAKGWAAPEVELAHRRARDLCQQVGETPQLFPVIWGLFAFYLVRGEWQTARELAAQVLNMAQHIQDSVLLAEAHYAMGNTLLWCGELTSARAHLEQGLGHYNPQRDRAHALLRGYDPGVACLSFLGRVLWHLGFPDQALQCSDEALSLAYDQAHPFSLSWALSWTAAFHQLRREVQETRRWAEAAFTHSTEQGFPFFAAHGMVLRGWALVQQGQETEGTFQLHQGLAAYQATGAEIERSHWLALLADAYGYVGQIEEGLHVLAEALAERSRHRIRYYEAELYRLKGKLLLQQQVVSNVHQAEACFHQALDVARRQQAKSLELRAAVSLSRLWQRQGKRNEARQLLAEIYGWFTEGFDTADLLEAKALLEELS